MSGATSVRRCRGCSSLVLGNTVFFGDSNFDEPALAVSLTYLHGRLLRPLASHPMLKYTVPKALSVIIVDDLRVLILGG
jgi:hypothetical protein